MPWRFASRLGHNEATQRCSTNKESCERHALVEVQGCASAMSILLVNGLLGIQPRENEEAKGLLVPGPVTVPGCRLPCRVAGMLQLPRGVIIRCTSIRLRLCVTCAVWSLHPQPPITVGGGEALQIHPPHNPSRL